MPQDLLDYRGISEDAEHDHRIFLRRLAVLVPFACNHQIRDQGILVRAVI